MSAQQPSLAETRVDGDPETVQDPDSHQHQLDSFVTENPQPIPTEDLSGVASKQDEREDLIGHRTEAPEEDESRIRNRSLKQHQIRNIVRVFQCRRCSKPFKNAITLPCGRSICKPCLPETHVRTSITYPAVPDRLEGFICPFDDCSKEHALSDCGLDVVLNKVRDLIEEEIHRGQTAASETNLSTSLGFKDPWDVAGISSLKDDKPGPRLMQGGRLVATWCLATEGELTIEAEVTYADHPAPDSEDDFLDSETKILQLLQSTTRSEVDCQVCYALFHDPFTTGCGHTFCRSCLHRTLDHQHRCPICRRTLAMNPLLNPEVCPSNESITRLIELFWPDEKAARVEAAASEAAARHEDLDLPLFICTLAFPSMPTFLHIFEPRYRLMIRRALEGNKTFGMVLPKRRSHAHDSDFHELGTLLRITNAQFYPDGRSVIETVGLTRFKVLRYGEFDGYTVARTERIDDVSLEEEEAMEATEVAASRRNSNTISTNHVHAPDGGNTTIEASTESTAETDAFPTQPSPLTVSDLQTMSTQDLMRYATAFVSRMSRQSVPWLAARMVDIYGDCPNDDPAVFPWWFASMLPVKDVEKYRLLGTSSVRQRLKICCAWILEWETTRW